MIHNAYDKSEVARRYYLLKTGEEIDKATAFNRWRMLRAPDLKILDEVRKQLTKEWSNEIREAKKLAKKQKK
jgi:hypothetical protein